MSYFSVLAYFILPPLVVLMIIAPKDLWSWLRNRNVIVEWRAYWILIAHVILALAYTTPWDNYLVATGVWWYEPSLVSGLTLGWVPIEEYIFFIAQTTLTGLWALMVYGRFKGRAARLHPNSRLRLVSSMVIVALWVVSAGMLVFSWEPGIYLALILVWALIPVFVQVAFGADILISRVSMLVFTIIPPTIYLWMVDLIAIGSGTWTIDPQQTTGIKLGELPIEEMLFFLATNIIIGFGMNLMLAVESHTRASGWLARLQTDKQGLGFTQNRESGTGKERS